MIQKEIKFKIEEDTLKKTYDRLIKEIQDLFIANYIDILNNNIQLKPQKGEGTFHYRKDLEKYKKILTEGWDTKTNNI